MDTPRKYISLIVHYRDGSASRERTVENDAVGRQLIDKIAFAKMASGKVTYCTTKKHDYVIQNGGSVR
jgi:hypothetical protein